LEKLAANLLSNARILADTGNPLTRQHVLLWFRTALDALANHLTRWYGCRDSAEIIPPCNFDLALQSAIMQLAETTQALQDWDAEQTLERTPAPLPSNLVSTLERLGSDLAQLQADLQKRQGQPVQLANLALSCADAAFFMGYGYAFWYGDQSNKDQLTSDLERFVGPIEAALQENEALIAARLPQLAAVRTALVKVPFDCRTADCPPTAHGVAFYAARQLSKAIRHASQGGPPAPPRHLPVLSRADLGELKREIRFEADRLAVQGRAALPPSAGEIAGVLPADPVPPPPFLTRPADESHLRDVQLRIRNWMRRNAAEYGYRGHCPVDLWIDVRFHELWPGVPEPLQRECLEVQARLDAGPVAGTAAETAAGPGRRRPSGGCTTSVTYNAFDGLPAPPGPETAYRRLARTLLGVDELDEPPLPLLTVHNVDDSRQQNVGDLTDRDDQRLAALLGISPGEWGELNEEQRIGRMEVVLCERSAMTNGGPDQTPPRSHGEAAMGEGEGPRAGPALHKAGPFGITLDLREWKATRGTASADFAGKEYPWNIFQQLCRSYPNSLPGGDLINVVWGRGEGGQQTLQAHMNAVRRIIEPLGLTVRCIRKVGYRLSKSTSR
jgi:hypothetical protein